MPAYVPATAASVELRAHQNGAIVADVTESLSACISPPNGCTIAVNAPAGASTWDAVTYDAQQNPLSANAGFLLTVLANATNGLSSSGTSAVVVP
jgi:hypothetical protein